MTRRTTSTSWWGGAAIGAANPPFGSYADDSPPNVLCAGDSREEGDREGGSGVGCSSVESEVRRATSPRCSEPACKLTRSLKNSDPHPEEGCLHIGSSSTCSPLWLPSFPSISPSSLSSPSSFLKPCPPPSTSPLPGCSSVTLNPQSFTCCPECGTGSELHPSAWPSRLSPQASSLGCNLKSLHSCERRLSSQSMCYRLPPPRPSRYSAPGTAPSHGPFSARRPFFSSRRCPSARSFHSLSVLSSGQPCPRSRSGRPWLGHRSNDAKPACALTDTGRGPRNIYERAAVKGR